LREWHYQPRRSGLTGDPYYLARPEQIRVQVAHNALADALLAGLRTGRVDPVTSAALARLPVRLLVPASAQAALPGWQVAAAAGGWVVLVPAIHRAAG
jgi:pyrrolidone-carboxylate peptidase